METIRRSYLNDFERCPRMFYYVNELGIVPAPHRTSIQLRMGSYLHSLVSGIDEDVRFADTEMREKGQVEVLYQCMMELEIVPEAQHEVYFSRQLSDTVGVEGTLDMVNGNWFGEMKLTGRPDYYFHTFSAQAQLEFYFFLSGLEVASFLPVRSPALRYQEAKESEEKFLGRLRDDILKRPSHYFPYYDPEKQPKWGLKFYRSEFDLQDTEKRLKWWFKEIKQCRKEGYWPMRKQNCMANFECQYLVLCESGAEITEQNLEALGYVKIGASPYDPIE